MAGLNNTGSGNIFFGVEAGKNNQGGGNVFLGNASGDEHTTGSDNTFVGVESGQNHQSGSLNTALGFSTKFAVQGLTNATAIGAQAQVGSSNAMVLGAIQGVNFATASTNVGIGTTNPSERLDVVGKTRTTNFQMTNGAANGFVLRSDNLGNATWVNSTTLAITEADPQVSSVTPAADNIIPLGSSSLRWTQVFAVNGTINTSDARLKKEVEPLQAGLEALNQLRPVTYAWKDEHIDKGQRHTGFLAQEVMKVIPGAVVTHEWQENPETGEQEWTPVKNLGINYSEITPLLVKAVQEQQQIIEQLREEIEKLKSR